MKSLAKIARTFSTPAGTALGGEERPHAVERNLRRKGSQDKAKHAADHVRPRPAEEANHGNRSEHRGERGEKSEHERGEDGSKKGGVVSYPAAQQDHRRHRPRPRDQRDRERKDGNIVIGRFGFGPLALRGAQTGGSHHDHVCGEQKQQQPASDLQRGQADAEST